MKRFCWDMLETRYKGHLVILLTKPNAIGVDEITVWVHYTHNRYANLISPKEDHQISLLLLEWKLERVLFLSS